MIVKFAVSENSVLEKAYLVDETGVVISNGVRGMRDEVFAILLWLKVLIFQRSEHIFMCEVLII